MEDDKYKKIIQFLTERSMLDYIEVFKTHRIDDSVAKYLSEEKLFELGFVLGDAIAFNIHFNPFVMSQSKTLQERKEELKNNLKRPHTNETGRRDKVGRQVKVPDILQVSFGLKTKENEKYVLKTKESFSANVDRTKVYRELHDMGRLRFRIPSHTKTFMGNFKGEDLEATFGSLGQYHETRRENKVALRIYVYYPHTFQTLQRQRMRNIVDDEEDLLFTNRYPSGSNVNHPSSTITSNQSPNQSPRQPLHTLAPACTTLAPPSFSSSIDERSPQIDSISVESPLSARPRIPPIRLRHSIGSPSLFLSHATRGGDIEDTQDLQEETNLSCFGDEEVERFLLEQADSTTSTTDIIEIDKDTVDGLKQEEKELLLDLNKRYTSYIILQ